MQPFELETRDGVILQGRDWLPGPDTPPGGVIQLVHGLGEHGLRYDPLARRLNAAGYVVTGHDNRGHGLTAGLKRLGLLPGDSGWAEWIDDILLVANRAHQHWPGVPHVLIGHSLGSLMAQEVAALHGDRFAALVLSATDNRPGPGAVFNHLLGRLLTGVGLGDARSTLLYWLGVGHLRASIPNRRTDADWLSRDPTQVDTYLSDPLCGFIPSIALWESVAEGMRRISTRLRGQLVDPATPLLLLVGTGDPLSAGGRRVRQLHRAYLDNGATHVTLREYPDARHELFNEINRNEVIAELIDWLNPVTSRQPTVAATG